MPSSDSPTPLTPLPLRPMRPARATVYLCGPIAGLTLDDAANWRKQTAQSLWSCGFDTIDPLESKYDLPTGNQPLDDYYNIAGWRANELYQRDLYSVRGSDIVLANLAAAERVSIGSVSEIAIAAELRKYVVLVLGPNDQVHRHPFVMCAASVILDSLDAAIEYIDRRL